MKDRIKNNKEIQDCILSNKHITSIIEDADGITIYCEFEASEDEKETLNKATKDTDVKVVYYCCR